MIGTTILHYAVLAELGSGAMGRVYLARDMRTDRKVALKFLAGEEAATAEARERLVREARAAARLSHPGIVALYAVEEHGGGRFLVEEYVEGETLARRLERGALSTPETLRLARELAAALAHAHAHGVLHRDLKPGNVLLDATGAFKIADFGIARLEGASTLTRAGTVLGSLPYLAPERLTGHPGDARADLFALGAVLYEAMSGRRAFPGRDEAEVMYTVMHEMPAPLEPEAASLRPLADLTLRLLGKEPRERPASAEVVAGILGGIGAGGPARPGKRRARSWIAVAAAAALVALAALALWNRARAPDRAGPPAVAVLAFENVADPADAGRMGSITGNLLITSLAQAADLNVLGTQRILDAMRQVGKAGAAVDRGSALAVARRARARRIVTGSILQTSPTIVMTAEVSDVETGKVLSATRVEGQPGQSVFQVVDALGAQLLQRMVRAAEITRLAPVAQRTSTDLEAQRDYAVGLEALSGGRMHEAVTAFRRAVERDPEFAQAQYQLAIADWWEGEPADARASIARARALAGRLPAFERDVVEGIGDLVGDRNDAASRRFASLEQAYPGEKLVHYGQVEAAFHSRHWPLVIESARRVLALDPDFTLAGVHLVDALRESGELDEAESEARALLGKDPKNTPLWNALFAVMRDRGDPKAALRVADEARAADPAAGLVRTFLSGAAMTLLFNRTGRIDVGSWPVPAETLPWQERERQLGTAYIRALRRGRFHEALRLVPAAWKNVPPVTPSWVPIPTADGIHAGSGARDTAAAIEWADTLGARLEFWRGFPTDRHSYVIWVQWRLGMIPEAAATLRRMESRPGPRGDFESGMLASCRALVLEGQGRHRECLDLLPRAVWFGWPWHGFGGLRLVRARAEMGAGMYTEALSVLDTLIAMPLLSPDDAVRLRLYRGEALKKLRRPGEAAASYREFLALWKDADPGTPEVGEARAALVRLERAISATTREAR